MGRLAKTLGVRIPTASRTDLAKYLNPESSMLDSSDGAVCGWVYVLSHPQMNSLKVGFTFRSVKERLDELSVTAVPGAFVWEYGVLVTDPQQVERQTHKFLSSHRVASNREFFSCPLPLAVAALIAAAEQYPPHKVHDRSQIEQRAASIRRERELLERWVNSEEAAISAKAELVNAEIESLKPHFAWFWLGHAFVAALIFEQLFTVKNEAGLWIISSIVGALSAFFHKDHIYEKRKSASSVQSRLNELKAERQAISEHSAMQSKQIDNGHSFKPPHVVPSQGRRPTAELNSEIKHIVQAQSRPSKALSRSLEERIAEVESRIIREIPTRERITEVESTVFREIPTRKFGCKSCGRTVNLNAKSFCKELRCPAKLLTDA